MLLITYHITTDLVNYLVKCNDNAWCGIQFRSLWMWGDSPILIPQVKKCTDWCQETLAINLDISMIKWTFIWINKLYNSKQPDCMHSRYDPFDPQPCDYAAHRVDMPLWIYRKVGGTKRNFLKFSLNLKNIPGPPLLLMINLLWFKHGLAINAQ